MIHVYEGDGKGKTTASIGLSIRAAGHGFSVLFIQFLKDDSSGEIKILKGIPEITVLHSPINYGFTFMMTDSQLKETGIEYEKLINYAINSKAKFIVLDELTHAINAGLVSKEQILPLLEKEAEIMITGRDAPKWLIERADYVSNVQKIKHPFDEGVEARIGVEF